MMLLQNIVTLTGPYCKLAINLYEYCSTQLYSGSSFDLADCHRTNTIFPGRRTYYIG